MKICGISTDFFKKMLKLPRDAQNKDYGTYIFLGFNLMKSYFDHIGRKYFYSIRKVKGKKNRQRKESDWKTYYGSSDILKEDIEKHGIDCFKRIILSLHITRGDCNFEEVKRQFHHNVLEEEGWYNANISGKYHRKPNHIRDARSVTKVVL